MEGNARLVKPASLFQLPSYSTQSSVEPPSELVTAPGPRKKKDDGMKGGRELSKGQKGEWE